MEDAVVPWKASPCAQVLIHEPNDGGIHISCIIISGKVAIRVGNDMLFNSSS